MLKLVAYDEHEDATVRLKLVTHKDEVDVTVVDEHGDPHPKGTLLAIRESGLYLYPSVCPGIGLPLDSEHRLKVFNPAPSEVMELLKPLAEYIAVREQAAELAFHDSYQVARYRDVTLTLGTMKALAAYYERNK